MGRARRLQHATLHVNLANHAARSLYASLGFKDAGVLHGYYRSALLAPRHVWWYLAWPRGRLLCVGACHGLDHGGAVAQ